MPRKERRSQIVQSIIKDYERKANEKFCDSFNGLDQSLKNESLTAAAVVKETVQAAIRTLKDAIAAAEDYFAEPGSRTLYPYQKAFEHVNTLRPRVYTRYSVRVDKSGKPRRELAGSKIDRDEFRGYELGPSDWESLEDLGKRIEDFKINFTGNAEHFSIGVCRYEKCRIFFLKKRKDERYCSKSHAKLSWQLEKRK